MNCMLPEAPPKESDAGSQNCMLPEAPPKESDAGSQT